MINIKQTKSSRLIIDAKGLLKWFSLISILAFATEAQPASNQNLIVSRFYSHLSTPAKTLDQGKISYETFPGANGETSLLVNSLSVGAFDWLQIGFVPLFYLGVPNHRWNANLKVNFVREKYFQVGAGYSHFSLEIKDLAVQESDGSFTSRARTDMGFIFVALNYRNPSSPYAIGLNIARLHPTSNSPVVERVLNEQVNNKIDWAADISFDWSSSWVITGGIAESRVNVFELRSPQAFGYGFSLSYLRPSHWFPRLTGGLHYMPSENRVAALFSFDL